MQKPGDHPADPPLFYRKHVFVCLNERAPGHPRGCCKEKGAVALRAYMKQKVGERGLEGVRVNQALCLDRCELVRIHLILAERSAREEPDRHRL